MGDIAQQERSRSLLQGMSFLVVMLALVAILMFVVYGKIETYGDALLPKVAADFAVQMNVTRSEWLLNGKPKQFRYNNVDLQFSAQGHLNNRLSNGQLDCDVLLTGLLGRIAHKNKVIVAIEATTRGNKEVCRFKGASGSYFDYLPVSHQIILTKELH